MATIIQNRRDTRLNWIANDPILNEGEIGFETDTGKFKIGNGISDWLTLKYAGGEGYTASAGFSFPLQFENDVDDALLYKDAAAATPVDGTGGTALYLTKSLDTTTPLIGEGSLNISKSANNAQGEGFSFNFTIDRGQVTSEAQIQFIYETSVNYVDNDIGVYIYDITNSVLMYPSIVNLPSTYGKPSNTLITFIPSTSNSYRLIFHVQSVSALAYSVLVDNIQIGNKSVAIGAAIGNWRTWTPTTLITNAPGSWTVGQWRRNGSNIEIILRYSLTGPVTSTMTLLSSALLAELGLSASYTPNGLISALDNGNTYLDGIWDGGAFYSSVGVWGPSIPFTWASGDTLTLKADIPISQWTSNINMATDFQEFAFNTDETTSNNFTSFGYGQEGVLLGSFAPTGVSAVTKRVRFRNPVQSSDLIFVEILKPETNRWINALDFGPVTYSDAGTISYGVGAWPSTGIAQTDLDVNFYSKPNQAPSTWSNYRTAGWRWRVRKVSNGNMAEVPPVVRAEYNNPVSSIPSAGGAIVQFTGKVEDTHNCVTLGANWKFTAPIDGVYLIQSNYRINSVSPWTSLYDQISLLMKNNSIYTHMLIAQPAINLAYWHMVSSQSIRLKAGDDIHIQHSNSSNLTETCQAGMGGITITRIGN